MAILDLEPRPHPGEIWLGAPPYLLLAHVIEVDEQLDPPVVSYELYDDDGGLLEQVSHATLDGGWWRAFQPLVKRCG